MHEGYKCLDRSTGRLYISRDVVFDEPIFPFASHHSPVSPPSLNESVLFPQSEPVIVNDHVSRYDLTLRFPVHSDQAAGSVPPVIDVPSSSVIDVPPCTTGPASPSTAPSPPSPVGPAHATPAHSPDSAHSASAMSSSSAQESASTSTIAPSAPTAPTSSTAVPSTRTVRTHSQTGHARPKQFTDGTVWYNPYRRAFFAEPSSHRQAEPL